MTVSLPGMETMCDGLGRVRPILLQWPSVKAVKFVKAKSGNCYCGPCLFLYISKSCLNLP
jgi:hypothetical protein